MNAGADEASSGSSTKLKAALVACGLFAAAAGITAHHHRTVVAERRQAVTLRAAAIEKAIEEYVADVAGAAYEVADAARSAPEAFSLETVGPEILSHHRERVAYVHFLPHGVSRQVYPAGGNETLLGLDVFADPLRGARANLAVRTRLPTLDGPHALRQGTGDGLVVRVPLFRHAAGTDEFWAFATATTTLRDLLHDTALDRLEAEGVAWSLVREDGRVVAKTDGGIESPVVASATLPNDSWTLSLAPVGGWGARDADLAAYLGLFAFTAALAIAAYRVIRLPEVLRRAVQQQTVALDRAYREREAILNGIPDPAWMKDAGGRWVAVNAALGRLAGCDPAKLVGKRHRDVFPQGAEEIEKHDAEVVSRGVPMLADEFTRGAGGTLIWFEVVKHPYRDGTGAVVGQIGIARDVTERRRAELALRDSEERFRQLVENTSQLFWIAEREESTFLYVSPACDRVWGGPPAQGRRSGALAARVHADDRGRFVSVFDEAIRGAVDAEYRIRWPDGSLHWIRERIFPIRDDGARVYRVAGIAEDVSEQRAMEVALLQSQKMEAIGHLAGGIAHDFNNLLCVISANAGLICQEVDPASAIAEDAHEIRDAVARAKGLTQQLLAFSRRQVLQPRVLRIAGVLDDTAKMLRRLVGEDIELRATAEDDLWSVRADPGQIEQVVVNLAVNARDAMPSGGKLAITARNVVVDARLAAGHEGASAGPHVLLEVADTGTGIDPQTCARIFEPFFTTKPLGKGTGLGLSTVYGIVKQSRGFVEVETAPHRGTTFRVYLPRCEDEAPGDAEDAGGAATASAASPSRDSRRSFERS
ncbi:MAG TPA: PAS domain S-box protein [Anaeromyxobacteraceae bacterium]|nr:PAS domain S-box protein [Anaeromyxobacteraceae bacterium]